MKENILTFDTKLSTGEVAGLFQLAVKRRPLKLKVVPFKLFKPTPADDPFADLPGSLRPEFEAGAIFSLPGPDPAMGSVILGCRSSGDGTTVMVTSTGNMRGRLITNSLQKHVVDRFKESDPRIDPQFSTGSR